ncbi:MAG: PIN domain-containing protein [Patescibacteria group bacterium]|jgi:uncharacterized protein YacL|nr:PIN domain-containing protein [Patescibacteria group bacterium]
MNNSIVFIAVVLVIMAIIFELIERVAKLSMRNFFILLSGAFVGLMIGALLTIPLSKTPGNYGEWLPITITVILVFGFITFFWQQREAVNQWLDTINKYLSYIKNLSGNVTHLSGEAVVDTSVLIDGRILDIAKTGFLQYKIIIPRFILQELQNIADSDDPDRRAKGRRGLDVVEKLKKPKGMKIEISNDDISEIEQVDAKLVAIAKKRNLSLLTTDFNLNKVAKADNVNVLNINELSQSIRPVILPGEEMELKVIHEGKEKNQGVGYLPDGTMIVVEQGNKYLNKTVKVKITRVLQTAAGKMFFSKKID